VCSFSGGLGTPLTLASREEHSAADLLKRPQQIIALISSACLPYYFQGLVGHSLNSATW
jgi:hypothetical protein